MNHNIHRMRINPRNLRQHRRHPQRTSERRRRQIIPQPQLPKAFLPGLINNAELPRHRFRAPYEEGPDLLPEEEELEQGVDDGHEDVPALQQHPLPRRLQPGDGLVEPVEEVREALAELDPRLPGEEAHHHGVDLVRDELADVVLGVLVDPGAKVLLHIGGEVGDRNGA